MSTSRTEEASPRRVRDALARGDGPRSRDLATFLVAATACVLVPTLFACACEAFVVTFDMAADIIARDALADGVGAFLPALAPVAWSALVVVAAIAFAAALGAFALRGFVPAARAFFRRSPSGGGKDGAGAAMLPLRVFAALATTALVLRDEPAMRVAFVPADVAVTYLAGALLRWSVAIALAWAVVAAFDVVMARIRFRSALRTTRYEAARERREQGEDVHARRARRVLALGRES